MITLPSPSTRRADQARCSSLGGESAVVPVPIHDPGGTVHGHHDDVHPHERREPHPSGVSRKQCDVRSVDDESPHASRRRAQQEKPQVIPRTDRKIILIVIVVPWDDPMMLCPPTNASIYEAMTIHRLCDDDATRWGAMHPASAITFIIATWTSASPKLW
jgi:hypothetical protein